MVHPVSNPLVKGVSFTGSTQTGKSIAEKAAPSLKVSLKNPNIILKIVTLKKQLLSRYALKIRDKFVLRFKNFVQRSIYENSKMLKESLETSSEKKASKALSIK